MKIYRFEIVSTFRRGFYTETKRFFFSLAERYGGGGGYYFNCIFIIVAHFDPLSRSF